MKSVARTCTRRRVLKGVLAGTAVTVGLPVLECMLDSRGEAYANGAPLPVFFGTWFWGLGVTAGRAVKLGTDGGWSFHEECAALENYRSLINYYADFNLPLDGRPSTVHFTGYIGAKTGTVPLSSGHIPAPTFDVLIAQEIGRRSRFSSLELVATGNPKDSYSYRGAGAQNVGEVSAIKFYERLFGPDFNDPARDVVPQDPAVLARQSVLSSVREQTVALERELGAADRARLDQYLSSIRELEQRLALQLEKAPPMAGCLKPKRPVDGPIGVELGSVTENHRLLTEMLVMAVACDQTRVFNMVYSMAASEIHLPGAAFTHHILTHEEPEDARLGYQVAAAAFNTRSMESLASFIGAFAHVREGDRSLLDRALIYVQTDTSRAKTHSVDGIPVLTVGRANGRVKAGQLIRGRGEATTRVGFTAMRAVGLPLSEWGTGSLRPNTAISEVLA